MEINVQEPWFTLIKTGHKTVEGRLNKGKFSQMNKGDIVSWCYKKNNNKKETFKTVIVKISKYPSFEKMLKVETLKKTLPGVPTIKCGVRVYREFYDENKEKEFGVLAITLKKI
jgi:ASC-1-like (ASCH) protein